MIQHSQFSKLTLKNCMTFSISPSKGYSRGTQINLNGELWAHSSLLCVEERPRRASGITALKRKHSQKDAAFKCWERERNGSVTDSLILRWKCNISWKNYPLMSLLVFTLSRLILQLSHLLLPQSGWWSFRVSDHKSPSCIAFACSCETEKHLSLYMNIILVFHDCRW